MIYIQIAYPLENLINQKSSKISKNPVSLIRNSKYKNGKLLNLSSRTYTNEILTQILTLTLSRLKLANKFNFEKFISTKITNKHKLILSIFLLDLVQHLYENSYKYGTMKVTEF